MKDFVVTSFYTKNTGYAEEVKYLIESLNLFKLDYYIEGIDSLGSWDLNTKYKVDLILHAIDKFPSKNVVYVDADARFKNFPELFHSVTEDLAVHYRNDRELLSGTLFFNNNCAAKSLLNNWKTECTANPKVWDQRILQAVLSKIPELSVYKLPAQYCKIFDLMKAVENPVIEHYQASRRFKKLI